MFYVFDVVKSGTLTDRLKYIKKHLTNNKYIHIKEFYEVDKLDIKYL